MGLSQFINKLFGFRSTMSNEIIELSEQALQDLKLEGNKTHFGQTHKLFLGRFVDGKTVSCNCCNRKIRAPIPAYCCIKCKFYIHICCEEKIPQEDDEIKHPYHSQHLLHTTRMRKDESRYCKACTESIRGVSLSCLSCSFDLHVSCIKPSPRALKHKSHNHNLFYFKDRWLSFLKCNVCYKSCDGSFYRCVDCDKNFHLECIPIPRIVKNDKSHQHPVMLLSSLQLVHDGEEYCCEICDKQGNAGHHVYYCDDCNFIAHVECVLLEDNTSLEIEKCDDSESKSDHEILNFQVVSQKSKQRERDLTISHFCHEHDLKLCNLSKECKATCSYCKLEIYGLAYICVDCRFIIHESCSAMPREILHQYHPKKRLSANPVSKQESVTCNACMKKIKCIKFNCSSCSFALHLSCANKPLKRALKLECHEHDLFYFVENGDNFSCKKCCKKCKGGFYRCPECGISLHVDCIPVPRIMVLMEHTRHRLNLILLDLVIEEYSDDHHCEFCKKTMNPEDHVYYGQESNFFAHIECLFAEGNIISSKKLLSLDPEEVMEIDADCSNKPNMAKVSHHLINTQQPNAVEGEFTEMQEQQPNASEGENTEVHEPSMVQDDPSLRKQPRREECHGNTTQQPNAADPDESSEANLSALISGLFSHISLSLSSLCQRSYAFAQTYQHLADQLFHTTQLQKHFFVGLVYLLVLILLHSLGFFIMFY